MIPSRPENRFIPSAAQEVLSVAYTYLRNTDRLIYSYGSKTFLSGYALYDETNGGKGNIDCSTFLLLVLAGIPYEASPYSTGSVTGISPSSAVWAQTDLVDFSTLPEKYIDIAERIGRPYLACSKGLDLEKAAALGISVETLGEEIRKSGALRRSTSIAQQLIRKGACFSDPVFLCPGDIAFFRSSEFFRDRSNEDAQIVHVGIITEDPSVMIHSSGYLSKSRALAEGLPAVAVAPVFGNRSPAFFARPDYTGATSRRRKAVFKESK